MTAEVLKLRESGASIVDIARTLGIGVGSVHRAIVADIKKDPPSQSTGTAGSTNPGESAILGTSSSVPDSPTTNATTEAKNS